METRDIALIKALSNGAGGASYTLPIASETTLGGVKPIAKTAEMTQSVGVDDAGVLWTKAASGGGSSGATTYKKILDVTTEEEATVLMFDLSADDIDALNNSDYWFFEMSMPLSGSTNTGTNLGRLDVQTYTNYATNYIVFNMNAIPTTEISYAKNSCVSALYKICEISNNAARFVCLRVSNQAAKSAETTVYSCRTLTKEKLRVAGETNIPSGSRIVFYAVGKRSVE